MDTISINAADQIISLKCSVCRTNTIYIKVNNYQTNRSPFKTDDFTCTECNQGMMQTVVRQTPTKYTKPSP